MKSPGIGFRQAEVVLTVSVQRKRADTTFALFPKLNASLYKNPTEKTMGRQ